MGLKTGVLVVLGCMVLTGCRSKVEESGPMDFLREPPVVRELGGFSVPSGGWESWTLRKWVQSDGIVFRDFRVKNPSEFPMTFRLRWDSFPVLQLVQRIDSILFTLDESASIDSRYSRFELFGMGRWSVTERGGRSGREASAVHWIPISRNDARLELPAETEGTFEVVFFPEGRLVAKSFLNSCLSTRPSHPQRVFMETMKGWAGLLHYSRDLCLNDPNGPTSCLANADWAGLTRARDHTIESGIRFSPEDFERDLPGFPWGNDVLWEERTHVQGENVECDHTLSDLSLEGA